MAIDTRDETLIPSLKLINDFFKAFNVVVAAFVFLGFKNLATPPRNIVINLMNSLAATYTPPPAKPVIISFNEKFLLIHPITLPIAEPIDSKVPPIILPKFEKISPKLLASLATFEMVDDMFENISENPDDKESKLKLEFNDVKKSPIDDVIVNNIPARPFNPPKRLLKGLAIEIIVFLNISKTEKTPLKVLFILSAVSPLIVSLDVKFLIFSEILTICSDTIGGKISTNASLIGVIDSNINFPMFFIESTKL